MMSTAWWLLVIGALVIGDILDHFNQRDFNQRSRQREKTSKMED